MITWQKSLQFCQWVGKQLNMPMSLPSEAQWEYAARNRGKNCPFPTNNCKLELGENFPPALKGMQFGLHEILKYPANTLGFYDMSGSGPQWSIDSYAYDFYGHSPIKNPINLNKDEIKVVRGSDPNFYANKDGTIDHFNMVSFSSYNRDKADDNSTVIAFRCVVNSDKPLN